MFITRTSETVDALAMSCVAVKDYPKATFSGFVKRLRPKTTGIVYSKYIAFFLRSKYFRKVLDCNTIMTLRATHQDVGQMDMYIRMYDELKRSEGDNPTIGIVLCSDTDDDIARYSVMHGNEQLFASKYKLYLPTKEELKAEIETQKAMFYLQQQDKRSK